MSPFDWAEYLPLAARVRQQLGGEAAERCAISRAYYACYGVAHAYAQSRGYVYQKTKGNSHQQVWGWYLRESARRSDVAFRQVWNDGNRLKDLRVKADCRPFYNQVAAEAEFSILLAGRLLEHLSRLP